MAVSQYQPGQSDTSTPESTPASPTRNSSDEENVCEKYFLIK